ncbi:MAG: DUF4340 domain-containing protein [Candidatus Sumerlaeia bacterium]|nr:DUF4340 domain-containing protein [Candidatus Sumerlaeia bacterium]
MKKQNLTLLLSTAGTIALLVATIFVVGKSEQPAPQSTAAALGETLLPGVAEALDDVTRIQFNTGSTDPSTPATLTLEKKDGKWTLAEADSYEVKGNQVNEFLVTFRQFKPLEEKTSNPARYSELGVQDPDGTNPDGALVILGTEEKPELAEVIIGKQAPGLGNSRRRYVRLPEAKESWLVESPITINTTESYWLNTDLVDIAPAEFSSAILTTHSGDVLSMDRPTSTSAFITEIPEGMQIKNQRDLDNITRTFQRLTFEDVKALETSGFDSMTSETLVLANTFGGLVLNTTLRRDDVEERWWGTIAVEHDATLHTPGETALDVEAATKLAEELNTKLSGWAYKLPAWKTQNLTKEVAEFFQPIPEPEPEQGEGQPSSQPLEKTLNLSQEEINQLLKQAQQ